MEKEEGILGVKNIIPYFYSQVEESLARRGVVLLPETKVYIVGVAQDFVKKVPLHEDKPLTLAYGDSLHQSNKGEKIRKLIEVGDRCLVLVGFFPDSITKRQGESGLEYHIKMGSSAYVQVGSSFSGKQPLFFELAERFTDVTKILGDVYSPFSHSPDGMIRQEDLDEN